MYEYARGLDSPEKPASKQANLFPSESLTLHKTLNNKSKNEQTALCAVNNMLNTLSGGGKGWERGGKGLVRMRPRDGSPLYI